ncbi:NAC transcription factor 47 [Linum grandiflorum]
MDSSATFFPRSDGSINAEPPRGLDDHQDPTDDDQDHVINSLPPGFRFCPRDDELVVHYLRRKVLYEPLPMNLILEVNLYKYDPDTVAAQYPGTGEGEWYFFTPRDRKYPNGDRPNRAAGNGYWKATGADRRILVKKDIVGFRKALVYYYGKPPRGVKSNWIMHEYKLANSNIVQPRTPRTDKSNMRLDEYILCRIYRKSERPRNSRYTGCDAEEDYDDLPCDQDNSPTAAIASTAAAASTSSLVNPTDPTGVFRQDVRDQQQQPAALPILQGYNNIGLGAFGQHHLNDVAPCDYLRDFDWNALDLGSLCFDGGVTPLPADEMDYGLFGPNSFGL